MIENIKQQWEAWMKRKREMSARKSQTEKRNWYIKMQAYSYCRHCNLNIFFPFQLVVEENQPHSLFLFFLFSFRRLYDLKNWLFFFPSSSFYFFLWQNSWIGSSVVLFNPVISSPSFLLLFAFPVLNYNRVKCVGERFNMPIQIGG